MDEEEQRTGKGYAWEAEYKRSWDVLKEDQNGSLETSISHLKQKRQRLARSGPVVQRGILRQLVLVIDASTSMADQDLRPNRLECTLALATAFIADFLDHNPLSLITVVGMRDGIAQR